MPLADGTLVPVPGTGHSDETLASLLTLSDVLGTYSAMDERRAIKSLVRVSSV